MSNTPLVQCYRIYLEFVQPVDHSSYLESQKTDMNETKGKKIGVNVKSSSHNMNVQQDL